MEDQNTQPAPTGQLATGTPGEITAWLAAHGVGEQSAGHYVNMAWWAERAIGGFGAIVPVFGQEFAVRGWRWAEDESAGFEVIPLRILEEHSGLRRDEAVELLVNQRLASEDGARYLLSASHGREADDPEGVTRRMDLAGVTIRPDEGDERYVITQWEC